MPDIHDEAAYRAAIMRDTTTPCDPELCPRCARPVGRARKVDGTSYLAELGWTRRSCPAHPQGDVSWHACKRQPHYLTCGGDDPEPNRPPVGVCKGARVVVVRGRKVPRGTTGRVFWTGVSEWGERVGIKDDAGAVHWTALSNVEVSHA